MKKSLEYSKALEGVGFSRDQAEVLLRILAEVVEDEMATKSDILAVKSDTSAVKSDLSGLKSEISAIRSDVSDLKSEVSVIKADVSDLKSEILVIKSDISTINQNIDQLKLDVDMKFKQMEYKLTIKLGLMMAAGMGALATLIKIS